ncbi:MAG: Trk system potassium transporter TrkA [candidate division Zixibacteria bacterium]|nr:Trk system potassium transporter TrkA [candidate division Zixibacteria bacterium]MBU1471133.1 Trk system potassium transporter TrkA [candidate division Zixibacteria bacterium]
MNITVIGMGEVGKHIAGFLAAEEHDVTIIDSNPLSVADAEERMDVMALVGQGGSIKCLRKAEVAKADLVIAVTDDDEANMLAALGAKSLGAKKTIARISSREYLEGESGVYHDVMGIDLVICPQILSALEITKLVKSVGALMVENFAENRVELIQLKLNEQLKIVGKTLKEVTMPPNTLIAAVARDDRVIIPSGDDELLLNDEVLVIGMIEAIEQVEELFGKKHRGKARKAVIVGGGEIGFSLVQSLKGEQIEVTLIEKDAERCKFLSESLENALIINGDGTSMDILEEVGVAECDIFISVVSRGEEVNLLTGLLAKKMGARKSVVLANKPDYRELYEQLGIDAVVSPRLVAANQIMKYVRAGRVVSTTIIEEGKAEILEIIAPPSSRIVEKSLKDLNFPKGAVIGAVVGPKGVMIPTGDDTIAPNSTVIVFTIPSARKRVEKLFKIKMSE